jgi:hypothetical protein
VSPAHGLLAVLAALVACRPGSSDGAQNQRPLLFEANRGQTDSLVAFLARGPRHTLFLTPSEAVLVLTRPDSAGTTGIVLRMTFVGANPRPRVAGLDELPAKANYFVGRDPARWRTNVPLYAAVQYSALYPGIDLRYSGDERQAACEFVVRPGSDPRRIALDWRGVDSLEVDPPTDDLLLHTAGGTVRLSKPLVYQQRDGAPRQIAGGYARTGEHQVGFEVAAYDAERPLVIKGVIPLSVTPTTR